MLTGVVILRNEGSRLELAYVRGDDEILCKLSMTTHLQNAVDGVSYLGYSRRIGPGDARIASTHGHWSPDIHTPSWTTEPIDSGIAWVDYAVVPDEFLIYFGGKPVPAVSDPLDAPGFDDVAIMIGLGPDDEETGEIVGIHVIPMMLGAVPEHPQWAVLTWATMAGEYGAELLRERLPMFLDEVAEAFRTYWKPAPPIEEQLAEIARRRDEQGRVPRSA